MEKIQEVQEALYKAQLGGRVDGYHFDEESMKSFIELVSEAQKEKIIAHLDANIKSIKNIELL